MSKCITQCLLTGVLLTAVPMQIQAQATIPAEVFLQPRSGQSLTQLPGLRRAALDWIEGRSQRLTIRYPGGEESAFWARELRDWLVALGVASSYIELLPGTPEDGALVIEPW